MSLTADVLSDLEASPWYRGQVVHVERQAGRASRHRRPAAPLAPELAGMIDRLGIELYEHQAQVIDRWRDGADVLIATRTSSGKSLAYNLAAAESLLADRRATALYLFPTKALAHDQLEHLVRLDAEAGLRARPAAYDGDTPRSERARIRAQSRVIVTNPYGLHEYLPQARTLQRFLGDLAVVVVDEAHRYRGVFGSHVSLVLRRLQRLCQRLGARPRFVLASGTIANPGAHAADLIGRPVSVVTGDGATSGERAVALWDSMADPDRSAALQAAELVATLARGGRRTLCFTGSRIGAELVAGWAAERARPCAISPYRAGFTPAERRDIEQRLRRGHLHAVVSTNALELGIDIGGLDVVVLTGYPGTVASTWQQIGRAGRAGQPSLAVLVAGSDPLDQYLVRRPQALFGAPVERSVVSLTNPEVLAGQVLCAAAELPVGEADQTYFGTGLPGVLDDLEREGLVAPGPAGHTFSGGFRPASAVRLDGQAEGSVEVRVDGEVIEVLERWRALREAHEGAILVHRGQRYRVGHLDLEAGRARAEVISTREHTEAIVAKEHRLGRPDTTRPAGRWQLSLGAVEIHQQVTGYKLRRGDEVVAACPLTMPAAELHTRAVWMVPEWMVPDGASPAPEGGAGARRGLLGALHAAEHAMIHAMPLLAMCDRGDAGGLSTLAHPGTGTPMIIIYDGREGGAGVADMAYECFGDLVRIAADMLDSCDCERGCPRCVYDRACGSENEPMDRRGGVDVLRSMGAPMATGSPARGSR